MIFVRTTLLLASCSALYFGLATAARVVDTRDPTARRDSVRITGGEGTEDTPWTERDDADSLNDTPWVDRVRREDTDSVRITGGEETDDTPWGRRSN